MTTKETIHVNAHGEFDRGCICGSTDFYTVNQNNGHIAQLEWYEVEPVVAWDGWACINCNRIFDEEGVLLDKPKTIEWMK